MSSQFTDIKEALAFVKSSLEKTLPPGQDLAPEDQYAILGELNHLSALLAPPEVALAKLCFGHHILVPAKIAFEIGVFKAFAANKFQALTLDELHQQSKGDLGLLGRILRMLCAGFVVKEVGLNKWEPLPLAIGLGSEGPAAGFLNFAHWNLKPSSRLYDYLANTGFQTPNDAFDGPFQYSMQTKDHFLEFMDKADDTQIKDSFNAMMTGQSAFRGQEWFEFFPVQEKLIPSKSSDVVLVDVGGNLGQDAARLRNQFPDLPGRIIVQDLPSVVKKIDSLPKEVEAVGHDFFTPQPIRGAKAYYFRTVLHDWPDKQVSQILQHIRDAMEPDSILLVNDNIIPDTNAPAIMSTVDFFLLGLWASKERTEGEWKHVLEAAGFKLERVWRPTAMGMGTFAVFEATKA